MKLIQIIKLIISALFAFDFEQLKVHKDDLSETFERLRSAFGQKNTDGKVSFSPIHIVQLNELIPLVKKAGGISAVHELLTGLDQIGMLERAVDVSEMLEDAGSGSGGNPRLSTNPLVPNPNLTISKPDEKKK